MSHWIETVVHWEELAEEWWDTLEALPVDILLLAAVFYMGWVYMIQLDAPLVWNLGRRMVCARDTAASTCFPVQRVLCHPASPQPCQIPTSYRTLFHPCESTRLIQVTCWTTRQHVHWHPLP